MSITQWLGVCIGSGSDSGRIDARASCGAVGPTVPGPSEWRQYRCLFGQQTSPEEVITDIPLPGITGKAVLHSRVVRAAAGSQAQGRFAYEYRVDLSNATTFVDLSCVLNLSVKFGPIEKLPYAPNSLRDVYEIKQGVPPNQIGFSSAVQTGELVTFTFERPVCAAGGQAPAVRALPSGSRRVIRRIAASRC
jgi:hypothetical protein